MRALALVVGVLALAFGSPANAVSLSHRQREKAEVRAIFAMLLARMEPGDGWHYDVPCVFSEDWGDFIRDEGRTARRIRPHALLNIHQAIDPKGEHRTGSAIAESATRGPERWSKRYPTITMRG